MPDDKEVKRKQIVSEEEKDEVVEENVEQASEDKDTKEGVPEENGAQNGSDHATPDIKEADKEAAPEPEPEKPVKSPGGEKRPLEDEDEDSQDSVEAKRLRPEEAGGVETSSSGEAESPHKANLSGQLIAC